MKTEYLILGEETIGGVQVYRRLATTYDMELAQNIFDAIVAGEAYQKVLLVQVIDKEG